MCVQAAAAGLQGQEGVGQAADTGHRLRHLSVTSALDTLSGLTQQADK